jgi:UDP-GlcNAc:undecaprenyl-phosphate GlcNAc-1-phosphate transferase
MLALFPLISPLIGVENTPSLPLPYAAAILLIPILDTTAAVWRRLRDGRRIDSPDQSHIHHKLMNMGLSSRHIDAVLFTLQLGLGLLVYIAIKTPGYCSLGILFLAYAAGIGFFSAVHFLNRRKSKHSEG